MGHTARWLDPVKAQLRRSFAAEHTPRETAGSFALGIFLTTMPTLGMGLVAFVVLAWVSDRTNRAALLASLVVINPVVKWGVYATSFALGVLLLGPVPGASIATLSLSLGPDVIARVLVGNTILAVAVTVPAYVLCLRLVEAFHAREVDVVEEIAEIVDPDAESRSRRAADSGGSD